MTLEPIENYSGEPSDGVQCACPGLCRRSLISTAYILITPESAPFGPPQGGPFHILPIDISMFWCYNAREIAAVSDLVMAARVVPGLPLRHSTRGSKESQRRRREWRRQDRVQKLYSVC
jgi:hypothetical protein